MKTLTLSLKPYARIPTSASRAGCRSMGNLLALAGNGKSADPGKGGLRTVCEGVQPDIRGMWPRA